MYGDDASALALALAREDRELRSAIERMGYRSDEEEEGDEEVETEEGEAAERGRYGEGEGAVVMAVEAPLFQPVHRSWGEFEAAVKAYAADTYQLYVVRTTTSVKTRNSRIAELNVAAAIDEENHSRYHGSEPGEKMLIPTHWRWYSKTMMCTHGWKDRHRGKGKRSQLMIRSTGCPVKMCATLQFNRDAGEEGAWQVVVTKHVRTHNHPLTKDLHLYYTENRRVYDPELLALGGSGVAGGAEGENVDGDDSDVGAMRTTARAESGGLRPMAPKSFASWELFHKMLLDYSVSSDQNFRIRSTISAPARNAKLISLAMKNGRSEEDIAAQLVPDGQKWHSKLFICDFGWKRKSRSKALQHQQLVADGSEWRDAGTPPCPAMIMARLQRDARDKWRVVINRQVLEHNHEISVMYPRDINLEQAAHEDTDHIALHDDSEDEEHMDNDEDGGHDSALSHPVDLLDDSVDHLSQDAPSSPMQLNNEEDNQVPMFELSSHDYETSSQLDHQDQEEQGQAVSVVTQVVVRVPRLMPVHDSWDAFHTTLQQYSEATYQSYRTRTTTSAKGRNQKIIEMRSTGKKDSHGAAKVIPEQFGWYSKTLTCTHGWKERRRGSGKRVIQGVRSTACPVKICATLQFVDDNGSPTSGDGEWRVIVTKHVVNHNHNLSKELYKHYCDNRRVYDPDLLAIHQSTAPSAPTQSEELESSDDETARTISARNRMSGQPRPYATVAEMDRNEAYATHQALSDTAYSSPSSTAVPSHSQQQHVYSSHSTLSMIPFPSAGTLLLPPPSESHAFSQPPLFTPAAYLSSTEASSNQDAISAAHSSEEAESSHARRRDDDDHDASELHQPAKRPRMIADVVRSIVPSFHFYPMGSHHEAPSSLPPIWTKENNVQPVVVTEPDGKVVYRVPRLKRRHETWDGFGEYLAAYSNATYQLYRVRTTSSISARNSRIAKQLPTHRVAVEDDDDGVEDELNPPEQLVPSSYEWYSKTYVCTHGWKTRHRGKGQRVSHNLRSTACPAKLSVTLQRDPHDANNWNVVVTKHLLDHNHEISASVYQSYSTNRRVKDPVVLAKAEQMWREGVPRRDVFEYLKEATDSQILMKDVHNLVQKWQQRQQQAQPPPGQGLQAMDHDEESEEAHARRDSDLSVDELMV